VYLSYLAANNPEYIDAKMTDTFPFHSQLMAFPEHGWHYRAASIYIEREAKVLHNLLENLDEIATTQSWWRQIFCGRDFQINLAKDQIFFEHDPEYEISQVIQDLLSLSYSNEYEFFFALKLAPFFADIFLGESSGLRVVSAWLIEK
jgi:hypothetical protein